MVSIEGGEFLMGTEDGFAYEGPIHRVAVDGFHLDETEVTNAEFAAFVEQTGYRTTAEELGNAAVFEPSSQGWLLVDGADWRHPEGPNSSIVDRDQHPVVHVSWQDADAFCEWEGKRLPTEAEWEYAARGGLAGKRYAWGDELNPEGKYLANYWQGSFPNADQGEDGFAGRAPVKSYPPNGYGLYEITGNVWEWVADWFDAEYYRSSPVDNPQGPRSGVDKIQRGGSWLCARNSCLGYRVAARMRTEPESGNNNLGFRCAAD